MHATKTYGFQDLTIINGWIHTCLDPNRYVTEKEQLIPLREVREAKIAVEKNPVGSNGDAYAVIVRLTTTWATAAVYADQASAQRALAEIADAGHGALPASDTP